MSTRSELKENILAAKVEVGLSWILANRGPVLTSTGIFVVAILIGSVFVLRNRERMETNLTQLSIAQSMIEQHQYNRAEQLLQDLKSHPIATSLVPTVSYYEGVAALGQKKFPEAEQKFREAVDGLNRSPLKPLALSNLGFTQEEKKDYDSAAQTYSRFMAEFSDHFLAPRVQLSLGRVLVSAGKVEEAKKALSQLIDLYPTSYWAENARSIMDKFKTR